MDWDTSSFGNDGAQEWLKDLSVSKTGDPVRIAIETIYGADNFIDAGDAERAIAACEIIAASRGVGAAKMPAEATLWIKSQRYRAPDALVMGGVEILGRIISKSELRDLWDGTNAAKNWLDSTRDLQARLEKIDTSSESGRPAVVDAAALERCFNEAVELVAEGAHDAAVQRYDEALGMDPGFVIGYIGRGTSCLALGKFEEALLDFNRAIDLAPEITEAYYLRAQAYFQTEQIGRVIADLTILLNMDPRRGDAYFMRGLANSELGRFDKAVDDYTRAIELDPESVNAYLHRSQAYEKLGRFDLAGKDEKQYERLTGTTRSL